MSEKTGSFPPFRSTRQAPYAALRRMRVRCRPQSVSEPLAHVFGLGDEYVDTAPNISIFHKLIQKPRIRIRK